MVAMQRFMAVRRPSAPPGRDGMMRIELTVPEQVYRYLEKAAKANVSSVRSEARTCLIRGALVEWQQELLASGASLGAIATSTGMPLEVVLEALGPVAGEGRLLGER
jgi:hypothetical protein